MSPEARRTTSRVFTPVLFGCRMNTCTRHPRCSCSDASRSVTDEDDDGRPRQHAQCDSSSVQRQKRTSF
jgi:hypothetical protein